MFYFILLTFNRYTWLVATILHTKLWDMPYPCRLLNVLEIKLDGLWGGQLSGPSSLYSAIGSTTACSGRSPRGSHSGSREVSSVGQSADLITKSPSLNALSFSCSPPLQLEQTT